MVILDILSKIGFNWQMALANLVNFLIIFWLLKRFAFEPLKKILKERADKIDKGLEDAKKTETEFTMAKQKSSEYLAEARATAQEIVTKAHDQSKKMLVKAKADTESQTQALVQEARELIAKEKQQMTADLEAKTVDIALLVAEKILREKIDSDRDKVLIEKMLSN